MKKIYLLLSSISLFLLVSDYAFSQPSYGGQPLSFAKSNLLSNEIDHIEITPPDIQAIIAEADYLEQNDGFYRIATIIPVNLNMENSGTWDYLEDGTKIWRIHINMEGAKGLALYYKDFHLPKHSQLFLYNQNRKQIIGAFDDRNNPKMFSNFSNEIIQGSDVYIEYIQYPQATENANIDIYKIAYVYRGVSQLIGKYENSSKDPGNPGDSGPCQVNVNCPEGADWQKQKRGIAEILVIEGWSGGLCTGSLINNTSNDGTPYFLTAGHCGGSDPDLCEWQFYFNYEASGCTNPSSPPSYNTVSGAIKKAIRDENTGSDMLLLELNTDQATLASFNAYYNGWYRGTDASPSGVSIHHPSGDIKKISTYTAPLTSDTWQGDDSPQNAWWRAYWVQTQTNWGVMEGGSSGAPIFNNNQLIVGTHTGGASYCNGPTNEQYDLFGKFDYHWTSNGATANNQLKPWLDPNNIGVYTCPGFDPNNVIEETPIADFTWTGGQCSGDTLVFTDASNPAGNNCVWQVNGNTVSEGYSTFSYTFPNVSTPTDFQVSLYVFYEGLTVDTTKNITIYPLPTITISTTSQTVCQGNSSTLTASGAETYVWSTTETNDEINVIVYESTTFSVTGTDINSCVSTASIDMFVMTHDTTLVYHNLCEGDTYDFYGTNLTEQGIYYHTLASFYACDSVIQLELTVNPNYSYSEQHSICEGDIYSWNGQDYTETGTYTAELTNVYGCDSIITLNLTVNPLPEQVIISQSPENGILSEGTSGSITIENSIVETDYWVSINGTNFTEEVSGTGSELSLGNNFTDGSYDIKSRNQHGCSLVQGIANFVTEVSGTNKIVANVSFGTPASNFPANHVNVKLYKATTNNETIVLVAEQLLSSNGQVEFTNLETGDYYLASFIQYPDDYDVVEHIYYQTAVVHEDAISIPIAEETLFIANLHHVLIAESQGSNEMQGIVGATTNQKSLNPLKDMVVVLRNTDINEIIGVSVTNDNGQYHFDNITDNVNIQAFVTSFEHQDWIAFEKETGVDQTYNINFIVDGTSIYPQISGIFEDIQIKNIVFTVFPNPAREVLYINCDIEKAIVQIFDINGKLIYTDFVFSNSEINISELISGTYIIILSAENGKTGVQKFVKE